MHEMKRRASLRLAAVLLAVAPLLAAGHVHAGDVASPAACAACTLTHQGAADLTAPPSVAPANEREATVVAFVPAAPVLPSLGSACSRAPPASRPVVL